MTNDEGMTKHRMTNARSHSAFGFVSFVIRASSFVILLANFSNRSTTSSSVMPSVQTSTASAAGASGPTGRLASSRSRRSWAASTCSSVTGSPCDCRSRSRRRARSSGLAVRKILHSASGKATVPWSRPSVTTLSSAGQRPLELDQVLAHLRVVGGVAGHGGHFRGPHRLGHVLAVQQDPLAGHLDIELSGQPGQVVGHVPIQPAPHAGQRHGPIHRPGIEKAEPQPPGQGPGHAALSGSGGSVDGDDHAR